jgi:hypothetical protein
MEEKEEEKEDENDFLPKDKAMNRFHDAINFKPIKKEKEEKKS